MNLHWEPLDWDVDDGWVYRLDAEIYPCDSPCTPGLMKALFAKVPSLAFKLLTPFIDETGTELLQDAEDASRAGVPQNVLGVAVFLPLSETGWQGIIRGELVEGALDNSSLFYPL